LSFSVETDLHVDLPLPESSVCGRLKILITILSLAILLFTGCKSGWINAKKMNQLQIGMTKADVVKILGEPHSSEAGEGVDKIWYLHDEGGYKHQPYFVNFKGGKVIAYGRGESSTAGGRGGAHIIYTPK
jgi:hypothetical protein